MCSRHLLIVAVVGLFASATTADTIYVDDDNCPGPGDGSELNPYCSIQTAIDNAVDTDEIVVAPGFYPFEAINLLGKAVTLRSSHGPRETVLTTFGAPLETATFLTCDLGEGPETVIDGLGFSGPIHSMRNVNSSPTVINCVMGSISNLNSSPTVVNSVFEKTTSWWFQVGDPSFCLPVMIVGGPPIDNDALSSPTLINCTISASLTKFICTCPCPDPEWECAPWLCDQQVVSASLSKAVIGGSPVLINCIVWGNSPSPITSGAVVINSTIEGGWSGAGGGNSDADPQFVLDFDPGPDGQWLTPDDVHGDLRISPGSPCIDAGHNNAIAGLTDTDLDGNPRFADDPATNDSGCGLPVVVDMGAYEYQGDPADVTFADLDGDGIVGMDDFDTLLNCWSSSDEPCCIADLDLSGNVNVVDFLILLANWE